MEITEVEYVRIKSKAFEHFINNNKVLSPIFGEIKVTEKAFNHIEWKNKKHRRSEKEAYIRYLCFMNFDYIIKQSLLYQDFFERYEKIRVKRNKKFIIENKIVKYYGLIAIVNNDRQRVKIVLKKVDGWKKLEYVSVIPVWKTTDYGPQLFLDSESEF